MRVFMRLAVIVLLIAVVGGIGYGVWDAGYERGLIEAADSTTEIVVTQPYRGGFFPFGAVFGFFFLFLLFGMMFKFAFGWRRWGGHYRSTAPGEYRSHMEERMARWHEKAHSGATDHESSSTPEGPVS